MCTAKKPKGIYFSTSKILPSSCRRITPCPPHEITQWLSRGSMWANRISTHKEILQRETKIQTKHLGQCVQIKRPCWTKEVCHWVWALQGLFCLVTVVWLNNYSFSSTPLHKECASAEMVMYCENNNILKVPCETKSSKGNDCNWLYMTLQPSIISETWISLQK